MGAQRPFKVIIFDVDNTLIYRLPRPAEVLLAFAQEQGLSTYPDALQRGERRNYLYYADGQADEERMLYGTSRFQRNYVAALLQAMCQEGVTPWLDGAVKRLISTPRDEHCPEDVLRVVQRLYEEQYHLVAISNRDGDLRPVLAAHGLGPYFAFTLSGGRAGVYKPNAEIFRIVLKTLGISATAAVTVGDSYHADIVGAQQVGITGVLLDPLGIFPEAQCRVIQRLDELLPWLIQSGADGQE
jgi:HAD superfamily hydrolase (TIGR01549 family)